VINLSLGGGGYSQSMADCIEYASSLGSVVVMAAGNSGGLSPEYPAAHARNHGLAVGAVDQTANIASFSNLSGVVEIDYVTAPGVDIYSSIPGNRYAFYNGTSMATPHVAGAAALLRGYDSSLSAESIEDLLTGTASNNFTILSSISQDSLKADEYDSFTSYIELSKSPEYLVRELLTKSAEFIEDFLTGTTSNGFASFSSTSQGSLIADECDPLTNYTDYITLETINSFDFEDLSGTIIGHLSTDIELNSFSDIELTTSLDNFDWEPLTNNLIALELGSSDEKQSVISDLLHSNHFDYFEVDQTWTIA
jgi:subtilisin family serine protease